MAAAATAAAAATSGWPVEITCWCFHISAADIGLTFDDEHGKYKNAAGILLTEDDIAPLLTVAVRKKKMPIKRGDLISLNPNTLDDRERNSDIFIYDGKKVIELDSDIDEYGAVPPCFEVTDTEFSPHYWRNKITHNSIFWLAQPILDRFRVSWVSSLRLHIASTTIGGRAYTILIAPRNDEELQAALDGEPVEPSETAAEIEANIKAGKYYFETNHCDLECIDLDVKPEQLFYALPRKEDEIKEETEAEASAESVLADVAAINAQLEALKKQKEELKARKRLLLFPFVLDHWLDHELKKYEAPFLEHVKVAPAIKERAGYGKYGSSTKTVNITYTWDEQVITACYKYDGHTDKCAFELAGHSIPSNKVYELKEIDETPEAHRLALILLMAVCDGKGESSYDYIAQLASEVEDGGEEE
jgi:hypothetical protein